MDNSNLTRRGLMTGGMTTGAVLAGAALIATSSAEAQETAASSGTGDKLDQILKRGHLIVGTGTDIPPFYFKDTSGELAGFEIDLARLLAKGLFNDPTKVEFVVQTSDARIPNLLSDRVDITMQNLTVTAARALQVTFSVPYYRSGQGFLMLAGGSYKNFAELKAAGPKVTISAIQNVFIADWVHEALPEAKVEQFPTPDAALQALNAGRADAHYIDNGRIGYATTQQAGKYVDSGFNHRAGSIACGLKAGEPRWQSFVDTALREAMHGVDFSAYSAALKKWLGIEMPLPKTGYPREITG